MKIMMMSPGSYVANYKNASYFELLKLKNELVQSIETFEKDCEKKNLDWTMCPSPDVEYQWNLQVLSEVMLMLKDAFNREYEMCSDDEEDYEYEPFEFELGEDICFLPKDAVYSVQVSLEKITKTEDGCIMSIFVKDPDDEKDQTFEFPVKVGDIIEMDELVPGVVCFVGPDREPAKLEILEIGDDYVSVRKVREE